MRPGELVHLLIEDVDFASGWLHVRGKTLLGWRVKTGRDRRIPLIEDLAAVLRRVIGPRPAGLVFLRPRFDWRDRPTAHLDLHGLLRLYQRQLDDPAAVGQRMSRAAEARTAAAIWRDAGMVKVDAIRTSFMRIMKQLGHAEATCPKSWRHAFATLLQDAGVDPLVRQITLGHQPINASAGALGMTSLYSHTPPETQRAEILRALRLWPQSLETAQAWAQGGG